MSIDEFIREIAAFSKPGKGFKPHKHVAILAIIQLIRQGTTQSPRIPFEEHFRGAFSECLRRYGGDVDRDRPHTPFFHLRRHAFWTLVPNDGQRDSLDSATSIGSSGELLRLVRHAEIDSSVFDMLTNPATCSEIERRIEAILREGMESRVEPEMVFEQQQGYSLFAHEKAALDAISRRVKTHQLGEVLTNLEVHDSQSNRYFEVDQVVISSCGVFVIELKHWSGRIEIRPNSWLQNDSFYKTDPHKANNYKAKLLKGLYERQFPSFPSFFFESVVVLTNPDAKVEGQSIPTTSKHNPTFDSIDSLVQYLKHRHKAVGTVLPRKQCVQFAEYVRKLHTAGPPRDFIFPGYEIVERLFQYADRAEVIAKRTDIRHRRLCRLRIFFPPGQVPEATRRSAHERAINTLNAVAKIGEHPNVLRVWDIPNENSLVVEGSDWSETGTLRDLLERQGAFEPERATAIIVGLLHGLRAAHKEYVIHRSLSPENVLMVDGSPKLMNFDLSYQLEDDRVTVIPDSSQLKRVPYIAPEIYTGGTVPEAAADLFSVGVLLYEMLTGHPPVKCSTDLERSSGVLTSDHRKQLSDAQCPKNLIDLICDLVQHDPDSRPSDTTQVLKCLEVESEPTAPATEPNRQLHAGERCGLYEIESFLRTGAESQIYKAIGLGGRKLALKLFNRDVPRPRVVKEHQYSGAIHHPSLVRVDSYGQWADNRYCIAFEWAGDNNLRDAIVAGERPSLDQFRQVAEQVLDALAALHNNTEDEPPVPLLHNDIKPDNILIGKSRRPVLVDFGAASEPRVGTYEGTEGYVASDLRLGQERQYCQDGDLYALAITLHEWLTGRRPVDGEAGSFGISEALLGWLRKGCHPEAAERFASVDEMRKSLQAGIKEEEHTEATPLEGPASEIAPIQPEIVEDKPSRLEVFAAATVDPNPFVPYLNSMHSCNAETDNALAEYQSVNPYFAYIHVPHPLVDTIKTILGGATRQHVIVTGHAGDGKSTIAVELFKCLLGRPIDEPLKTPLNPREDLIVGETPISLIKDYSEWSADSRASLLEEMLEPAGRRFFLISNTGTLLDAFKTCNASSSGDWVSIESNLLSCMEQPEPTELQFAETSFAIINIAMIDNLGMAEEIFRRMIAAERWQACDDAACHSHCPIYRNVRLIRENQEVVLPRLFLAYRRVYEYGTRLTLRQLCAHFAYMITSGLTCDEVVKMSQKASPPLLAEFMFFNRFFGDNGRDIDGRAQQFRAIRVIRKQDFGSQPCSTWERKLWLHTRGLSFQLNADIVPEDFSTLRAVGAGQPNDSLTASAAREQVRRAVFFLHSLGESDADSFLRSFLRSVMLLDFQRWQTQDTESLGLQERNDLRRRILHVLQEHFTGVRLPEGMGSDGHLYITLSRRSHDIRQSAQVVLARYPEDGFRVCLITRENSAGRRRRELVLAADIGGGQQTLGLSLPFLDYVMMRNQGEVGQNLQASYVDRLERFKGQLLRYSTSNQGDEIMLVRLRTNHTFRRQIFAVRNDHLEVSDG